MHRCIYAFNYIVYKSVLSVFTQEFSLVVWLLMCDRPENEPQKNWSVSIFLGLSDRPKIEIRSSAVCLRNFVIESAYVHSSALFESSSVFPAASSQQLPVLPGISLFCKHSVL